MSAHYTPEELDALYQRLLSQVEAQFDELHARFSGAMRCASGCHSCCHPSLTVSPLEARALRALFEAQPERLKQALELEERNPHQGARCPLLSEEGLCVAYEARPLVCRSFGAPLAQLEDPARPDERSLALCELNFTGEHEALLATLTSGDVIDTHATDTLLGALNVALSRALNTEGEAECARVALRASALISSEG
jgi:Fe-S-cluster containining protein